jgi:uncharacterized protein (TIGR03435 family)
MELDIWIAVLNQRGEKQTMTNWAARNREKLSLTLAACMGLVCPSVVAQVSTGSDAAQVSDKNQADVKAFAFEVVSIRMSEPGEIPSGEGQITQDEYRAVGWPLGFTVNYAYLPRIYMRRNVLGAPDWLWNDKYDFVAKVSPEDLKEWQKQSRHWGPMMRNEMLQAMLQAALAERCKLAAHLVPTKIPGYALVVSAHGPNWKNLKQSKPDEKIPIEGQKVSSEGGMLVPIMPGQEPVIKYFQTSMASLAAQLPEWVGGRPVEDRTGMTGKYDFALTRWSTSGGDPSDWDFGALGLKLQPIMVPAEAIERPSAN